MAKKRRKRKSGRALYLLRIKRLTSRLVLVLTGFFLLLISQGMPLGEAVSEYDSWLWKQETVSENAVKEVSDGIDGYTVKINEMVFYMRDLNQIRELLSAAKERYDTENEYQVVFTADSEAMLPVITARLERTGAEASEGLLSGGAARIVNEAESLAGERLLLGIAGMEEGRKKAESREDYNGTDDRENLALCQLEFADRVEIAPTHISEEELTPLQEAIDQITQDKQKEKIYEVQPGDTLSVIAMNNDISMDELVEINETLEDQDSVIRAGDELTITVPEPELSFKRVSREYYEENYNSPVTYVDNDEWYTTDTKLLQEPVAGYHRVVAEVEYINDEQQGEDVLYERVIMEPVAKIVERGTKVPPTYIKPISGGRMSSSFGKRSAPTKGASTYHKGIDWATPVGTAVMASGTGTVSRAGWGSGYGNVVYIDHPDGRQTRYGHLSKVLVKVGQHVNVGDKIALSGNTGRSTGPHIHFEMLIGGTAVNPLKYFN